MKINFPLLALAVGAFAIGTTEFSPMGFLPEIAQDLEVSIPRAGMLISAYALGVMLGAPLMTLWLSRYCKRKSLILLMAIFTIGNACAKLFRTHGCSNHHQFKSQRVFWNRFGSGCQHCAER